MDYARNVLMLISLHQYIFLKKKMLYIICFMNIIIIFRIKHR